MSAACCINIDRICNHKKPTGGNIFTFSTFHASLYLLLLLTLNMSLLSVGDILDSKLKAELHNAT